MKCTYFVVGFLILIACVFGLGLIYFITRLLYGCVGWWVIAVWVGILGVPTIIGLAITKGCGK